MHRRGTRAQPDERRSETAKAKPMRTARKPDIRRVRVSRSYSVDEIADLLTAHPNTVRRWLRNGLAALDGQYPTLIHGSELRRFLKERDTKRKQPCGADELPCFRCRAPRKPVNGSVSIAKQNLATVTLRGTCSTCGGGMWRAGSAAKVTEYALTFGFPATETPSIGGESIPLANGDSEKD